MDTIQKLSPLNQSIIEKRSIQNQNSNTSANLNTQADSVEINGQVKTNKKKKAAIIAGIVASMGAIAGIVYKIKKGKATDAIDDTQKILKHADINFEGGIARLKNGEKFSGVIKDSVEKGKNEAFKPFEYTLEYKDGVLIKSTKTQGSEIIEKTYETLEDRTRKITSTINGSDKTEKLINVSELKSKIDKSKNDYRDLLLKKDDLSAEDFKKKAEEIEYLTKTQHEEITKIKNSKIQTEQLKAEQEAKKAQEEAKKAKEAEKRAQEAAEKEAKQKAAKEAEANNKTTQTQNTPKQEEALRATEKTDIDNNVENEIIDSNGNFIKAKERTQEGLPKISYYDLNLSQLSEENFEKYLEVNGLTLDEFDDMFLEYIKKTKLKNKDISFYDYIFDKIKEETITPDTVIYHGTKKENAEKIIKEGFNLNKNENHESGKGVYGAVKKPQRGYKYGNTILCYRPNSNLKLARFKSGYASNLRVLSLNKSVDVPALFGDEKITQPSILRILQKMGYSGIHTNSSSAGYDYIVVWDPKLLNLSEVIDL